MNATEYLPFATGDGANVIADTDYTNLAARTSGFGAGVAVSAELNKVWRQSSVGVAALTQMIADATNQDIQDDGDVAGLATKLLNAIAAIAGGISDGAMAAAVSTGDLKPTLKRVADSGWVLLDDGTIGSAGSGASNRANADAAALYALIWNNIPVGFAPIYTSTGANSVRGSDAASDFNANKRLALPKALGRALGVAGAGANLTARTLGQTLGEEAHIQTATELAVHNHAMFVNQSVNTQNVQANQSCAQTRNAGAQSGDYTIQSSTDPNATPNVGQTGDAPDPSVNQTAMNVMQPTLFVNVMVKL